MGKLQQLVNECLAAPVGRQTFVHCADRKRYTGFRDVPLLREDVRPEDFGLYHVKGKAATGVPRRDAARAHPASARRIASAKNVTGRFKSPFVIPRSVHAGKGSIYRVAQQSVLADEIEDQFIEGLGLLPKRRMTLSLPRTRLASQAAVAPGLGG